MKKIAYIIPILLVIISCKKEPDHPPLNTLKDGDIVTIDSLISWYKTEGEVLKITDSISIFAKVTMDETEGNIYKNVYIQDGNAAINMRMTKGSNLVKGDSIRINLLGARISSYNRILQLDSINPDKNIIVLAKNKQIEPQIVSIQELTNAYNEYKLTIAVNNNTDYVHFPFQSKLVKLEGVQFSSSALSSTYANAAAQSSLNLSLEDCYGKSILVRTSGFSDFAAQTVAQGNGEITAIVGQFGTAELQIYIRSIKEVLMDGERCSGISIVPGTSYTKDFNDNSVTSGGWTIQQVLGTNVNWSTSTLGGAPSPYGIIKNYISGANYECENWLISPAFDFSNSNAPKLSFKNAYSYAGPALQLLISTNYDGTSNPNTSGTWTNLTSSALWSSGFFSWANSGDVSLSAYKTSGVYIAFKYTGTNSNGSTWELDDIVISD